MLKETLKCYSRQGPWTGSKKHQWLLSQFQGYINHKKCWSWVKESVELKQTIKPASSTK